MIRTYIALGLLLTGSAFAGAGADCKNEALYPEIEKKELQELISKKAVFVVDVNSKESFAEKHIPGAMHYEANIKNFAQKLPAKKDALIVAYCGGPQCTAWTKAAAKACELGYTNVKHFKPGIKGWSEGS